MNDTVNGGFTSRGLVLANAIIPALERGGYACKKYVCAGIRLNGGKFYVDLAAKRPDGQQHLISLKWQRSPGSVERKIPFEIICYREIIQHNSEGYRNAYLILAGEGWTLHEFYLDGGMKPYLSYEPDVRIVDLDRFIQQAERGLL